MDTAIQIAEFSRYIESTYPEDLAPELVLRRRIDKVMAELGEVFDAVEALTGENPRKGVYGDEAGVVKELLDVATCALGAVEHFHNHAGVAMALLTEHVDGVYRRAGLPLT